MWSQGFCGFVAHVKVNKIHSLLEAIFCFWRSYKLKLTQVEGCSHMQAWDIPESTGCTELESDAESSIHYQHLTSIWLSVTSIYLFFFPMFFSNKKNQTNKTSRLQGAWEFSLCYLPSLTSNQPLTSKILPLVCWVTIASSVMRGRALKLLPMCLHLRVFCCAFG